MRLMTLRQLLNQPIGTLAVSDETGESFRLMIWSGEKRLLVQDPNTTTLKPNLVDPDTLSEEDLDVEFQTKVVWFPED